MLRVYYTQQVPWSNNHFYAGLSYNLASVQKTNIIYPNNVHKFATVINNNFWHVIFLMATAQQ